MLIKRMSLRSRDGRAFDCVLKNPTYGVVIAESWGGEQIATVQNAGDETVALCYGAGDARAKLVRVPSVTADNRWVKGWEQRQLEEVGQVVRKVFCSKDWVGTVDGRADKRSEDRLTAAIASLLTRDPPRPAKKPSKKR